MKTKINALSALITSALLALTALGQGEPTSTPTVPSAPTPITQVQQMVTPANQSALPMLMSKHMLQTYAEEQAYGVSISISASLPTGNKANAQTLVMEASAAGIINTIHSISLSVDVVNYDDPLFTWAAVYNDNWDLLFSGSKQFMLVTDSHGNHVMPEDYKSLALKMADLIPISIPGAESAFVDELDDNGRTQNTHNLQVSNGKVYYPKQLTGGNRILAVYTSNQPNHVSPNTNGTYVGNWVYWNVGKGGVPVRSAAYAARFQASIMGTVTLQDCDVFVAVPTVKGGYGDNITAELKVTHPLTSKVSFWTTEGKWFTSALVRKSGTSQWVSYTPSLDTTQNVMSFNLPITEPGIYYVIPAWNIGDVVEPADPYYPPYNYNGSNGNG
jgi:hypothetical protein